MSDAVKKIFIKPANEKVLVRNPERNRHLKIEGEVVTHSAYWLRREKDGDVVKATPPKKNKIKTIVKD